MYEKSYYSFVSWLSKSLHLQPHEVQATAMTMSSSVRLTVSAYQTSGNVMAIQTVWMVLMNTTPAQLSPADPTTSSVPTWCASMKIGYVMVKMTAGTWVMNRTAPHLHLVVPLGSGFAPQTRCASTWIRCATARGTVQMEQMSHLSAVSFHTSYIIHVCTWHKKWHFSSKQNDKHLLTAYFPQRPKWLCTAQWRLQSRLCPRTIWGSVYLSARISAPQWLQDLWWHQWVPDPWILQPAVLQWERNLQVLLFRGLPPRAWWTHLQSCR